MAMLFVKNTITRTGMLAILLIALMAFLPGVASTPPIDRDEARFATSSRQMLATGDYITPRFQHELRAKKPVGIYWLQAASASVFGHEGMLAYRLPSVLGGIIIALIGTGFAARLTGSPRRGLIAGVFMATSLVLVAEAHLAKTDSMLAAAVLIQQIALWRMRGSIASGSHVSRWLALLFWGAMGLGILLKGPIAPLIAFFTIAMLAITERRMKAWLYGIRPMLGFLVLAITVLPWAVLVSHATDGRFLEIAIMGDLVSKLGRGQESHGAPPGAHLALLMVTFWPGSLLLMRGALAVWQKRRAHAVIFLLGWLAPFWIVIELTPTKLPHYFLPVMPAIAILATLGIDFKMPQEVTKKFRAMRLAINIGDGIFAAVSVILGVAVLYAASIYGNDGARLWGVIALLFALVVPALGFWWRRSGKNIILLLVALAATGFHAATFGGVAPALDDIHVAPRMAAEIDRIGRTTRIDSVALAGYHEPSAVFMLEGEVLLFGATDTALFLGEAPGGLAVVERRALAEFLAAAGDAGIPLIREGSITGYNISRGQRIELQFFRFDD